MFITFLSPFTLTFITFTLMAYGTRNNGQLLLSLGSHTNNSTLFAIKYYVDNGKRR